MKKFQLFCLVSSCFLFLFQSCGPAYQMAQAESGAIFFEKPIRIIDDETISSTYLSGSYFTNFKSSGAADIAFENNRQFQGAVHHAWSAKYCYFLVGASGNSGSFEVSRVSEYSGQKSYYGFGLHTEVGLSLDFNKSHIRPIGLRFSFHKEYGDYAAFRNSAKLNGDILDVHPDDFFTIVGIANDFAFDREKYIWGIHSGTGFITGEYRDQLIWAYPFSIYAQIGGYIKFKQLALNLTVGFSGIDSRNFFTSGLIFDLNFK